MPARKGGSALLRDHKLPRHTSAYIRLAGGQSTPSWFAIDTMQAFWEHPAGDQCLQDATLILPVASVGNVGQLAVDLVINTLRLGRVARLQDDALLPAVGSRPYAHVDGLATALEIYQQGEQQPGGSGRVAVAQQRSPAAPGTQAAFAERLAAFVKQSGVKEVSRGSGQAARLPARCLTCLLALQQPVACWSLCPRPPLLAKPNRTRPSPLAAASALPRSPRTHITCCREMTHPTT